MSRYGTAVLTALALTLLAYSHAAAQTGTIPDTASTLAADTTATEPLPPVPAASTLVSPSSVLGPNSPTPARPHMAVPRTEANIRLEHDQMLILANNADTDLLAAKKQQVEAKGTVEIKKREIDTINAHLKAAKQAKDDAARASFDDERKRQESMRDYFSHAQDVADAVIDEASARGEYGRAVARADEFELQLGGRGGVTAYDSDPSVFKLEQQYLEAVKFSGAMQEKLASKAQTLAERRLRLYKAWADYLGGK